MDGENLSPGIFRSKFVKYCLGMLVACTAIGVIMSSSYKSAGILYFGKSEGEVLVGGRERGLSTEINDDSSTISKFHFHAPLKAYSHAYEQYEKGLKNLRTLIVKFCNSPKPDGFPHQYKCQTSVLESEILYLRIRLLKPVNVLEFSSATGFSTMVILQALEDNGVGSLSIMDLCDTPWPDVLPDSIKPRLKKYIGDGRVTAEKVAKDTSFFDYLHIDTCHDEPCIQWYLQNILEKFTEKASKKTPVQVSMHDMFSNLPDSVVPRAFGRGEFSSIEGFIGLYFLAFSNTAKFLHSFANNKILFDAIQEKRVQVLGTKEANDRLFENKNWEKDYLCSIYFSVEAPPTYCHNCLGDLFAAHRCLLLFAISVDLKRNREPLFHSCCIDNIDGYSTKTNRPVFNNSSNEKFSLSKGRSSPRFMRYKTLLLAMRETSHDLKT
eukprot:gene14077-29957_t